MSERLVAFEGEVMLIGWDENHNVGRTARFLFDEEGVEHPMKQHTVRRGKQAGTRFMMVLVELQDDDAPVDQEQRARVERAEVKGGPVSKNAGMLCRDPDFQRYVHRTAGFGEDEEGAADFVREACRISSRAELDHQPRAEVDYELMRARFHDWQEAGVG